MIAGLLPHFQVVVGFPIESPFIQRSESIHSLIVFLLSSCLVKSNGLINVFVDHRPLFIQNARDPFRIWKFFYQFLSDVSIWAEGNCQQELTVFAFLHYFLGINCGLDGGFSGRRRGKVFFRGASLAATAVHIFLLILISGQDVVPDLLVLKRPNDFKDSFVADEPAEYIFELLGAGS